MVSNRGRKTKYTTINLTEKAAAAFKSCVKKKTQSKTMLEMTEIYKSKCLDHEGPGVVTAD